MIHRVLRCKPMKDSNACAEWGVLLWWKPLPKSAACMVTPASVILAGRPTAASLSQTRIRISRVIWFRWYIMASSKTLKPSALAFSKMAIILSHKPTPRSSPMRCISTTYKTAVIYSKRYKRRPNNFMVHMRLLWLPTICHKTWWWRVWAVRYSLA